MKMLPPDLCAGTYLKIHMQAHTFFYFVNLFKHSAKGLMHVLSFYLQHHFRYGPDGDFLKVL